MTTEPYPRSNNQENQYPRDLVSPWLSNPKREKPEKATQRARTYLAEDSPTQNPPSNKPSPGIPIRPRWQELSHFNLAPNVSSWLAAHQGASTTDELAAIVEHLSQELKDRTQRKLFVHWLEETAPKWIESTTPALGAVVEAAALSKVSEASKLVVAILETFDANLKERPSLTQTIAAQRLIHIPPNDSKLRDRCVSKVIQMTPLLMKNSEMLPTLRVVAPSISALAEGANVDWVIGAIQTDSQPTVSALMQGILMRPFDELTPLSAQNAIGQRYADAILHRLAAGASNDEDKSLRSFLYWALGSTLVRESLKEQMPWLFAQFRTASDRDASAIASAVSTLMHRFSEDATITRVSETQEVDFARFQSWVANATRRPSKR